MLYLLTLRLNFEVAAEIQQGEYRQQTYNSFRFHFVFSFFSLFLFWQSLHTLLQ